MPARRQADTGIMTRVWFALLTVTVAAMTAGCAGATGAARPAVEPPAPRFVRVGVLAAGTTTVHRVPLEEYVQATILSELSPASGDPALIARMFEVQAIISRTYVLAGLARHEKAGFDVCATTHCQLFQPSRIRTSRWAPASQQAVARTRGSVLWYDGAPVNAVFHADCGGHTSDATAVWNGRPVAYLVAKADDGPAGPAHTSWTFEARADAVARALNGSPKTRIGALEAIDVLSRDSGGRAGRIALRAARPMVVTGDDVRDALTRAFGATSIRSTRFDVRRVNDAFIFEGRGFGHGVGLCQAGAFARIRAGATPAAVLQRYYPGTRLLRLADHPRRAYAGQQ